MIKKVSIITMVLLFLLSGASAYAGGKYCTASAGVSIVPDQTYSYGVPDNGETPKVESLSPLSAALATVSEEESFQNGFAAAVALGYDFDGYRVEGEAEYRKNDFDNYNCSIETYSLMVNGYYDIKTDSAFTPFIGAGLGMATHETDDGNDTVFAYQAIGGVAYSICQMVFLDLAYRYFATSDPEFDGIDAEYDSHNISLGVRIGF